MRLLIVDDSMVVRSRIARITGDGQLGSLQIVGLARNGIEALQLHATHKPDLVTMDLTMPEMDGIECVRHMTAADPQVRILVVSALSDKATAIRALRQGAHGFLYKPFSDQQLITAIEELMEIPA